MNKQQAQNLIKTTFKNPYSRERFFDFARNIFKSFDKSKAFHARGYVKEKFRKTTPVIKTYERFGTFTDKDQNNIDILAVYLKYDSSLDRARTAQRNFIADYLKQRDKKDAALAAFVPPTPGNWRLSLVKMDYSLGKSKKGRLTTITELTPARRFSFSVGKDENTHTAQRQLLPILQMDEPPALSDLEKAFSVEVVSKDFFEKYKILFLNTKEALDKILARDAKVKAEFVKKHIDTVDFAKKLLGQIVFLYFLQKKGWFGVPRDKDWGTGPKDFLRQLFDLPAEASAQARKKPLTVRKPGDNFFNDILEPLFYEALAVERPDDFYSKFNCKIPFLNGGLFDPLGNYDWIHIDIYLPDELFSNNTRTKEGDIGDGILDVFDRYNFTVKEDEPLEKEVAVDPEMLGKVFENLLEVKSRKSKGTYYTPREIVHYMCQESLINYLLTELNGQNTSEALRGRGDAPTERRKRLLRGEKVQKKDLETLIRLGETTLEHETQVAARGRETKTYQFKLPQSIRKNAQFIDKVLEKIKVCDPAVGSGAFLVGMMAEIVRARSVLTPYIGKNGQRTPYHFKRHAIQNCLYGVDIDPGAVEIAKLRLWLSLIVDEESIKKIKPLPNLDYKVMVGNSLIDCILIDSTPIDIFKLSYLQNIRPELKRINLFDIDPQLNFIENTRRQKVEDLVNTFIAKKRGLFGTANFKEKKRLKEEINKLENQIIRVSLKEKLKGLKEKLANQFRDEVSLSVKKKREKENLELQVKFLEKLLPSEEELDKYKHQNIFLWELNFLEVFLEKGGFDVVIANPPYVGFHGLKGMKIPLVEQYTTSRGKFDLYIVFVERAFQLTTDGGHITYICPTNFMKRKHGEALRLLLSSQSTLFEIVDFGHGQIFESATNYTGIMIFQKLSPKNDSKFFYKTELFDDEPILYEQAKLSNSPWVIRPRKTSLLIERIGKNQPLDEIVKSISEGIVTGFNKFYLLSSLQIEKQKFEKTYFRKCLRGKEIRKNIILSCDSFVFYPYKEDRGKTRVISEDEFKTKSPNYFKFLRQNKAEILNRGYFKKSNKEWFELWNQRDISNFETEKILTPELSPKNNFALAGEDNFYSDTVCGIAISDKTELSLKSLLAILNSKLIEFYYKSTTVPKAGGFFIYKIMYLKNIPIAIPTKRQDEQLAKLQKELLEKLNKNSIPENRVREYEQKIDQLVYKLYRLTPEEIKIVEKNTK